jgi:hypothetical protein
VNKPTSPITVFAPSRFKVIRCGFHRIFWMAACLMQTLVALGAPGDEHWSGQFGWPGASNTVLSIAVKNGKVYAGGIPTSAFLTNGTLNVWDGIQWSPIGQFKGSTAVLYDLAFVGDTLYAAGIFTNVNGVAASGLARWDGAAWSSIGLKGVAFGLAVDGNNLYVAGVFTNAGSVIMTNIGCWDGTVWRALGNGIGMQGATSAKTVVASNGVVYVGGTFTNSGSQVVSNLAVWNGSTWSAVGGGMNDAVNQLALYGSDLYAAGTFTVAGSTPANSVARWNGATWSTLGSGLNGAANSIAFLGNSLCVAGSFTTAGGNSASNFAIWNGSAWNGAGTGLSATGSRVLTDGTKAYVGGNFLLAGGGIVNGIASWDGDSWAALGPAGQIGGLQNTVRSLANDGTNLYVGGAFNAAGQTSALRIGRYDGKNWHTFGTGLNTNVNAVAVVGTNIYAAGDFTGGPGGPFAYHLARWNGAQWTALNNTSFATVSALATRGNDLFVAGYFTIAANDANASWLTRWDGANFWNVLAFPSNSFNAFYLDGIGFTAMGIEGTNIYLSGHVSVSECDSELINCTNCNNAIRFDGRYARIMGSGLNSNATSIAVLGTNVYFAGPFTNAGGVTANRIAKWDGNFWSGVGGGVVGTGTINALASIGTNLYAGGTFTNVGGVPANRIAKWNGTTWSALGSGTTFSATTGPVLALTAVGSDLYVGGTFRTAGGKPSYYLARWNESLNFDAYLRWTHWSKDPAQFTITTTATPSYVVEGSTNLTTWIPLFTNSLTPYDFVDPNASAFPRRFYRARAVP